MAQTFVALPFLVVSLEGALRTAGDRVRGRRGLPRSARRRPCSAGSRCRWCCPAWSPARCWPSPGRSGEFGATITFAGSLQGAHPHAAARDLPPARDRPRRRRRAGPRAGRRRRRGDRLRPPGQGCAVTLARSTRRSPERGVDVAHRRRRRRDRWPCSAPTAPGKSTLLGVLAGLVRPDGGRVVLDGRGADRRRRRAAGSDGRAARPSYGAARPGRRCSSRTSTRSRTWRSGRAAAARGRSPARATRTLARRGRRRRARRPAAQRSSPAGRPSGSPWPGRSRPSPGLLLLDEPMAALDVAVQPALRQMLRRVLADRTAIVVTHDPLDALLLADRVVVLESGRVVEDGPSKDVLPGRAAPSRPGSPGSTWSAAPGATTPSGPKGSSCTASSRGPAGARRTGHRGVPAAGRRGLPRGGARQPTQRLPGPSPRSSR